ncbi:hypothetical protein TNIN_68331 [Trichonephila inaurata madagascariensis]|uniref:Uncharacterized protein n=1 Tax=Trichonephila inaurata madagascariensis TaxID=2747483 RepID=A0A8X7BZJ2_9ARAC|nr:hypothetical protein TNIN_68331 [Trichonephila inaurata madagascariensis]
MDQSLPSSNNSTRPGTPQETNCQRLQDITAEIKKFVIITENLKATMNSHKINGITDERELSIADLSASLEEYENLHQLASLDSRLGEMEPIEKILTLLLHPIELLLLTTALCHTKPADANVIPHCTILTAPSPHRSPS